MLEEVTADTLTEVGAADGAGGVKIHQYNMTNVNFNHSPASRVIAMTVLLTVLPAALLAVTVML